MKSIVVKKIKSAPKEPGVYIFYGNNVTPRLRSGNNSVLYVGKAANLRARLKSYLKIIDLKTEALHAEADRLDLIPLRSEIEALIEESKLIKELKPKYNVLWNDDKSYHYVYFTKEAFPKIFLGHVRPKRIIGPFTDGGALRLVMKLLRRQFPYCTCFRPHLRDCLNAQISRCSGYCCRRTETLNDTNMNTKEYTKNIRKIKMILRGQSKKLLKTLTDKKEREALNNILQHQPYLAFDQKNHKAIGHTGSLQKIECYDISHFAGKEAVGAMTVLVKKDGFWQPDKNSYRKFKIKSAPKSDDPRAIAEVLERRLNHPEWPLPDLVIIDGGITQYNAAKKVFDKYCSPSTGSGTKKSLAPELCRRTTLTAFPKPQRKLIGWEDAPEDILKLAERAIHQTHNFVIRYHRQVRNKEFLL